MQPGIWSQTCSRKPAELAAPGSMIRLMLKGVLWMLCSGAAWRGLPERFGTWSTVYQRFRDWRNLGTFDQMLKRLHVRLNERGLIDLHTWMIDSTAVRATRASSGAGRKGALTNPPTMRSVAAVAG